MAASREGIIASATSISSSGSLSHSLIKGLEDIKIHHDGSVRNASGVIFSFLYGDDALNPTELMKVKTQGVSELSFIDLETEFAKMNTNYGF
jgi:DNA-directed RNA polymerase beta' subunit